ncbi:unnamed protein product [Penicillium bialowiezense]
MRTTTFLALLAPAAVFAESHASGVTSNFAHNSPAVSIPELVPREHFVPILDRAPARSEGSLGQTPWIGMGIGLTFTALAAVMLG